MPPGRPSRSTLQRGGLWRIDDDRIIAVDRTYDGPTTVLAPAEQVLTLAVDLPFATRKQRLDALPFAVEDRLADPIADLHFALGTELSPRRHLVGVVRKAVMERWIALLVEAGLDSCILVPDALILPMPETGAWAVSIDGERALVRTDQGSGFALPATELGAAWELAGRPGVVALGGALPDIMRVGVLETTAGDPAHPGLVIPPLDLRQGPYRAVTARVATGGWQRLALIAGAGALAHVLILATDTALLHQMAERREVETLTLLQQAAPQIPANADPIVAAEQVLPSASVSGRPFTRLLAQTSRALAGTGARALNTLTYGAGAGLTLNVSVADAAALAAAVQALNAAGLSAEGRPAAADPAITAGAAGLAGEITVGAGGAA